jgi:hypothetical protein
MKKLLLTAILVSSLGAGAVQAATITGVVKDPTGTSPIVGLNVMAYKWDPETGSYNYGYGTSTVPKTGAFTIMNLMPGSYLVVMRSYGGSYQSDPFGSYGWYTNDPMSQYYTETYNDVTVMTPSKPPTQINFSSATGSANLGTIRLNRKIAGCQIDGPITINGIPYNYFYDGMAPRLPVGGGNLVISYKLRNFASTSITGAKVQPVAFLQNRTSASKQLERSVKILTGSPTVTVPANSTANVSFTITVPGALMAGTAPFNIGLQTVNANTTIGVCNLATFPVQRQVTAASRAAAPQGATAPKIQVPLRLDEKGQPLEWGLVPTPGQ